MLNLFDSYIGIDYSGKGSPSRKYTSIQVFEAGIHTRPSPSNGRGSWSRKDVYEFLKNKLKQQQNGQIGKMIIGIDHGFSVPHSYFSQHNLSSWNAFLKHFDHIWGYARKSNLFGNQKGDTFAYSNKNELRLTEKFSSSAKSVFNFDPPVTVAYSTHTGIPWLYDLRSEFGNLLHFWPFDGLISDETKTVIAEVYPSLFFHRYRYPIQFEKRDAKDAYAIVSWLQEHDKDGSLNVYFNLPTLKPEEIEIAFKEGWILGIL